MFGQNPKRSVENGNGGKLFIQSIFPTIQGEGFFGGVPAFFIRLGGCNLSCSFCDTEFESFSAMQKDVILTQILSLKDSYEKINLVVITGGEPFRQNIKPLCDALLALGFAIQIETNGTLSLDISSEITIICSPKCVNGKYYTINENLRNKITAFKFLISAGLPGYNAIPAWIFDEKKPVYIQPMDEYDKEKNTQNNKLACEIAMKNNFILSIQMHKILGID